MKEEQISVVIPVYNVEDYLRPCLDSVIGQTYENLEIILVDDGSTDHSGQICDVYQKKDSRIVVIHQENGGLSEARNRGIDIARGRYITFIDSDDVVDTTYCQEMLKCLKTHDADISLCNVVYFREQLPKKYEMAGDFVYDAKDAVAGYLRGIVSATAWGKLYKRELFKTVRYPKGKVYEDVFVMPEVLFLSQLVVGTARTNYYYRYRMGSIQHCVEVKSEDSIEAHNHSYERILQEMPRLAKWANSDRMYNYLNAYNLLLINGVKDARSRKYRQVIQKNLLSMMTCKPHCLRRRAQILLLSVSESLYDKVYLMYYGCFLRKLT